MAEKVIENPAVQNDGLDDLFYFVERNQNESERIIAPRYSYWKSVGRVFFKKKSNWIALGCLALVIIMALIYPLFVPYGDSGALNPNIMNPSAYNLSPAEAIAKLGFHIKWIFGTASNGNTIFNAVWHATSTSLSLAIICTIICLEPRQ